MPDQYTDDQIQAKIAERRAKTEEQRKRNKRRSLIQILCAFAALIVLVVAIVFGVRYTVSRMKANSPFGSVPSMGFMGGFSAGSF